ncbi:acyl transferase domain-containing protein/NAD(P)-dependent dehydrogenase (short-subunit alcohol dehydrogenase family)/acyl carrier protein [Streptomyces canus]|uniref:type I polyketide synthase n=1 Tax=Streptomyces canus TaxID=58343 RepID=UPI00277EF944|nr:type I polyketide synthase [Streptomyces canus]MDQ0601967.1 acyl transferase domain-containing protein/NAD(P)-dependent dehydrogenase (short-subunit alcohol dehydrogenase family)/acyl carrier protein [Streptomyces canus]
MPHDPTRAADAASEPIAIIGMAGRFADATSLEQLWDMLLQGRDAITDIPPERYDVDAVYDPAPRTPGRTVSRWGGLLRDIDAFDAEFFGISPREADRMDPQQRLLLEVAYEALEDAGQPLPQIAGTDAGVFIGQLGGDYWHLQYSNRDQLDLYAMTGAASRAITSGRLSYAFDLRGPSFTVDTACSSALVAVHNAVQAIRLGECPLAIAGGVNLVLLPEEGVVYSGAGMLASDGRCKFADASGDGFVRSDGIGAVILKPLSAAQADGDRIRAVIRGSAVGNDGQSSGYLVTPAVEGQRDVLRRAYANAGIDPADVDYIEAHGTGTSVGDPVELEALAHIVGPRPLDQRCLVGSVKTNIGHAEAAAGIAGLIKAVLCLENKTVPPNLHLNHPNPAVDWDNLPLSVPTQATPLPDHGRPAVAGVSSFGFSGTNAHLVLEAAPQPATRDTDTHTPATRSELLVLSALSPEALTDAARAMAGHLEGSGAQHAWRDICHSAALRRTPHDARLALAADSHTEAAAALRGFADGEAEPGLFFSDYTDPEAAPRIAFVFPGQGSQWPGMGRELLDSEPVFRHSMEACDEAIKTETGWSVIDLLRSADEERLKQLDVIQPTLWAMEIALAELWQSWGITPDVVIGHSMGESAAAYIAGALSLQDAAAVICRRSRLAKRLSGLGTMAWVALPADEAEAALAGFEDKVAVAAINSPTSTLLSGDVDALTQVLAALDARGIDNRRVNVDFASHCPQMDALREDLLEELAHLTPRAGRIPLHSTLLNEVIDGSGMDADYWVRNIRRPVDFAGAVRGQLDLGETAFIEVSPHPLLVAGIKETSRLHTGADTTAIGSLRRHTDERTSLLTFAAALHTAGARLDFATMSAGGHYVPLPSYPWQRTRHWISHTPSPATAPAAATPQVPPAVRQKAAQTAHPLLGRPVPAEGATHVWQGPLDLSDNAYLRDHCIQDTIILPGTAHLELIGAAARTVTGSGALSVSDVHYHRALFLDEGGPAPEVKVTVTPRPDTSLHCRIHSQDADGGEWILHTEATARALPQDAPEPSEPLHAIRARLPQHQDAGDFYPFNAARGNQWNGTFQGITELWRTDGEVLARLDCPSALADGLAHHHFHPALLDASGHAMAAARPLTVAGEEGVFVLGGIDEVRFYQQPPAALFSHARLLPSPREDSFAADIDIRDQDGRLIAQMRGLRLQYLAGHAPALLTTPPEDLVTPTEPSRTPAAPGGGRDRDTWLHSLTWDESPLPAPSTAAPAQEGFWLVLTDSGSTGRALLRELTGRGQRVVAVTAGAGPLAGGGDRYRIDPSKQEHYREILGDVARIGACRGILHLWALDAQAGLDATPTEIRRAQLLSAHSVLHLARALEERLIGQPPLWLITQLAQATGTGEQVRHPFQAMLWGLGRTLAAEAPALTPRLADLDRSAASVATLAELLQHGDQEDQIALRDGRRLAARLRPAAAAHAPRALSLPTPGVIDDLQLTAIPERALAADEVRIQVSHAGVNYRDVLLSLGAYPGQDNRPPVMGWECAGTVTETGPAVTDVTVGEEVIAFAEGALATEVVTRACLTAPKPAQLTGAEAATLPAAYLTAYHALHDLARLERGQKVLIHTATGGTGRAALSIARWKGARIFATAGSDAKRQLLTELGVEQVADSRSLTFADTFKKALGDEGFDAIYNTLAGDAIEANLSLMAPYGHYLELSKRDILDNNPLPLGAFARNLSFHAVDVVHMIQHAPERAGRVLRAAAALVGQGTLEALPHTVYPADKAADAFRLMAQSRHTGKIVLSFGPQPAVAAGPRGRAVSVHADGTYLITGGAGGIGGQLALWLADQGARHLLLTGRSQLPDPDAPMSDDHPQAGAVAVLQQLRERGVHVTYQAVDVADLQAMQALFASRRRTGLPPVRGVFHAAGVIDYTPLSDMSTPEMDRVLAAKVSGAWNLHRLLHEESVEAFVLFSSGSALLSSPMLGGYAAGNAFLDALAHHRHAQGLPATVINWGFWDSVGMVARKEQQEERTLLPQGMASFSPADGLELLGRILAEGRLHTAVLPADWPAWARAYPGAAAAPLLQHLTGVKQPVPSAVTRHEQRGGEAVAPAQTAAPTTSPSAAPAPQTATAPAAAARPVTQAAVVAQAVPGSELLDFLRQEAAVVMGLRAERVNVNRPLNRLGMDSLMAVELRNRIERRYQVKLPMVQLLKDGSITTVAQALAAELHPAQGPADTVTDDAGAPVAVDEPEAGSVAPVAPVAETAAPAEAPAAPESAGAQTAVAQAVPGSELLDFLRQEAAVVMGLRAERVNVNRPLNRLGMDSLMAVELRNRIERRYQVKLPMVQLLKDGSITTVAQALAAELNSADASA